MELYKKHRPTSFAQIAGNTTVVHTLEEMVAKKKLPHCILLHGPSGCGKTTIARILKDVLCCSDLDWKEMNCSDRNSVDDVRDIIKKVSLSPSKGKCRIWMLDEFHRMSTGGQDAALKLLEDTPSHAYFILCSSEPQKIISTIKNRATQFQVKPLSDTEMTALLKKIATTEGKKISDKHLELIVDYVGGSARAGLVALEYMLSLPEGERKEALVKMEEDEEAITLCRALIAKKSWATIAGILKGLKQDPETVRWSVLGYANTVLLNTGQFQAYHVICCFSNNFYDSKKAGLASACYEAVTHK